MRIVEIIWLDEFVEKLRREHAVEPEEVEEVLASRPYFFFAEKGHRKGENVYGAFGQSNAGRYLVVYFIYNKADRSALILSARDMERKDRRRYERR